MFFFFFFWREGLGFLMPALAMAKVAKLLTLGMFKVLIKVCFFF